MATTQGNRKRKDENRQFIADAKNVPCADCRGSFPTYVMDFDHRPGEVKSFNISGAGYWKGKEILAIEIAKCDIVCANCHRMRTHDRWQYVNGRSVDHARHP